MCLCVVLVCSEMILITQVLSVWNKGRCRHYRVYYDQVIFVCVCVCARVLVYACDVRVHAWVYVCVGGWVCACVYM